MTEETGANVLEPLLNDASVSEIMINGPQHVFVERKGRLESVEGLFHTSDQVMQAIQHLLLPLGERLDEQTPTADFRLPDGTHLNVALPPVALNGPCVTIRKPVRDWLTMDDLIRFGSITPEMVEVLQACVKARLNMLVSGGTGSGKTTVLNILTEFIPADERIVTVEEVATIQVRHNHVVSLQSHLADSNGTGAVTMRDLVRNAARMRPERVIFGEFQGAGVLDALQLIGRGHDGSLLTIHATSAEEALEEMEMLIMFNHPDLPIPYLRKLIGSALDIVVQQTRLPDGSRKVTAITEVVLDRQEGYILQDIAVFKHTGVNERGKIIGSYQLYPLSESIVRRLQRLDLTLPSPFMQRETDERSGE
jgi:pilus assembly protein CpaF